jgi:hypothetical protein
MYYTGVGADGMQRIGVSSSSDGLSWRRGIVARARRRRWDALADGGAAQHAPSHAPRRTAGR